MSILFARRRAEELAALQAVFGSHFNLQTVPVPGITGTVRTTNGVEHVLYLALGAYPARWPDVYVVSPELRMRSGRRLRAPNHTFHVGAVDAYGHPRLCLHHPASWTPATPLTAVVAKALVWLEAFSAYRATGRPMTQLLRPVTTQSARRTT